MNTHIEIYNNVYVLWSLIKLLASWQLTQFYLVVKFWMRHTDSRLFYLALEVVFANRGDCHPSELFLLKKVIVILVS